MFGWRSASSQSSRVSTPRQAVGRPGRLDAVLDPVGERRVPWPAIGRAGRPCRPLRWAPRGSPRPDRRGRRRRARSRRSRRAWRPAAAANRIGMQTIACRGRLGRVRRAGTPWERGSFRDGRMRSGAAIDDAGGPVTRMPDFCRAACGPGSVRSTARQQRGEADMGSSTFAAQPQGSRRGASGHEDRRWPTT